MYLERPVAGKGSEWNEGPISCSKRALPEGAACEGDTANETFLVAFGAGLTALPRGGVGGGIVPAGGLDFAMAFATAFGRPTLRVVVVTVLPRSACILLCHFFVLIQK